MDNTGLKIINMLPYDINVYGSRPVKDGPVFTYPKTGKVARVVTVELGCIQGPELWYETVEYKGLEEFPDPQPGVFYIVSLVAALAGRDRGDLLAPYHKVRNAAGLITGCTYLQLVK